MARQSAHLVVAAITLFAACQLYRWYSVIQLYCHGIGGGTYVSYAEHAPRIDM